MQCVSPFWNAVSSREAAHELQYTNHSFSVQVPINGRPPAKLNVHNMYEIKQTKAPAKVLITVPYLINTVHVPWGTSLKAVESGAVLVKRE